MERDHSHRGNRAVVEKSLQWIVDHSREKNIGRVTLPNGAAGDLVWTQESHPKQPSRGSLFFQWLEAESVIRRRLPAYRRGGADQCNDAQERCLPSGDRSRFQRFQLWGDLQARTLGDSVGQWSRFMTRALLLAPIVDV